MRYIRIRNEARDLYRRGLSFRRYLSLSLSPVPLKYRNNKSARGCSLRGEKPRRGVGEEPRATIAKRNTALRENTNSFDS